MDFGWVRLCAAFGAGVGEDEIAFVRTLMPNLQAFAAVEPDPMLVGALQRNFHRDGLETLGIELAVVETPLERWNGATPVDAALLSSST